MAKKVRKSDIKALFGLVVVGGIIAIVKLVFDVMAYLLTNPVFWIATGGVMLFAINHKLSLFKRVKRQLTLSKRKSKEYGELLSNILSAGDLNKSRREELRAKADELNLSKKDILTVHTYYFQKCFQKAAEDSLITKAEKDQLSRVVDFLENTLHELEFNQADFNRMHLASMLDQGELPTISSEDSPVPLRRDETLHWANSAITVKHTKRIEKINYSGLTASIKIAPGLKYRLGSISPSITHIESSEHEDSGYFWISNQRFGFKGEKSHLNVKLNEIAFVEINSGFLLIFREGRKRPLRLIVPDLDLVCSLISAVMNNGDNRISSRVV